MNVDLWSRRHGLVGPPAELLYAVPGSTDFPDPFRVRVLHWAINGFKRLEWGTSMGETANAVEWSWARLYSALCASYGRNPLVSLHDLARRAHSTADLDPPTQLSAHVQRCPDLEVIDFIDAVFQVSAQVIEEYGGADGEREPRLLGEGIDKVFAEEGIGYRWVEGEIVRYDDGITHDEAVRPALELLAGGQFGEANSEFRAAVDDYRRGRWRDVITNANAAFESALRVITGEPSGQAGGLIRKARTQGLLPGYAQSSAENLEKLMSGLPAIRGQQGSAHGLGERAVEADRALARLALTMSAAFLLFLGARQDGRSLDSLG